MKQLKLTGKALLGATFVISLFIGAAFAEQYIQDNEHLQSLISSFGHFGIFIVSIIGGLNLFVPVPPTAFIPVFQAAGFSLFSIISVMVIGTTLADFVAYYLGVFLKKNTEPNFKVYIFLEKWCKGRPVATGSIVFLYAAFIPFPNEVLLLPLGALGVSLVRLVPAFVTGTIIHVSLIAYGFHLFG